MSFFNIKNQTDTSAEIEVYGEIVTQRPKNWWTGEESDNLYFVSQEFNEQIDKLKECKNLTVKINSPGGDLFVGVGVYNKLKQLDANITVIVEGLAASAAGLIACAGDTVKLGVGAIVMAHQASTFISEWSLSESEIEVYHNQLKACDKAIAEIISAKTGKPVDEIEPLLAQELWLSGQEAIDFGFADEMLDSTSNMFYNATNNSVYSNGKVFEVKNFCNDFSKHLTVIEEKNTVNTAHNTAVDTNNSKKEEMQMSTPITLEVLKAEAPQLLAQIQQDAANEAVKAERQRQKDIDQIGNMIADKQMLDDAKYGDDGISAKDLFWNAGLAQKEMGVSFFANMKDDVNASGANAVTAEPDAGTKNDADDTANVWASSVKLFNSTKEAK